MGNFKIEKATTTRINNVDWDNLGFGVFFSDHIFVSDYDNGKWDEGKIIPYGPMPIEPTMCTLHYGQSIFEGLKAFRDVKGGINIFRPDKNAARLNHSGSRVCIPPFDEKTFVEAIKELVRIDINWV
ncbi:MAG TPA: branched chain amino acid aminotransferase, partial [Candidatus Kapabacteria bacterium]|nr:branched chain amino acid aminotransferase [Candidatus Kapabacteria bacterium]